MSVQRSSMPGFHRVSWLDNGGYQLSLLTQVAAFFRISADSHKSGHLTHHFTLLNKMNQLNTAYPKQIPSDEQVMEIYNKYKKHSKM